MTPLTDFAQDMYRSVVNHQLLEACELLFQSFVRCRAAMAADTEDDDMLDCTHDHVGVVKSGT
eukprot:5662167-Amphidinium_carterae.1